MYKAILLSIGSPIMLGIYYEETNQKKTNRYPKLIFMLCLEGKTSDVLPLLFVSHNNKVIQDGFEYVTTEISSKCNLCECLIDSSFLRENTDLNHVIKMFNITYSVILKDNFRIKVDSKIDSQTQCNMESMDFLKLDCSLSKALYILSYFMPIDSIYYSRGVGSLSSIKLTHVFLHTIALSRDIKIYATNSFYFSQTNEIKAFANMSFYLDISKFNSKVIITDTNAKDYIYIAQSSIKTSYNYHEYNLSLPYLLIHDDFLESCTPLYVTPVV